MTLFDFSDIRIQLDVGDTREMRPDTLEEVIDDGVNRLANELWWDFLFSEKSCTELTGLAAWLPPTETDT